MSYNLEVQISPDQLEILKESGYNLCLAKKVNDMYNVVWSANAQFGDSNGFEWTEDYQVLGLAHHEVGSPVIVATNAEDITFGQTCVLDQEGTMLHASNTPSEPGQFKVASRFLPLAIGVNQRVNNVFAPVFVNPTTDKGLISFQPAQTVKVWFGQDRAGTIISSPGGDGIEVDYFGGGGVHLVEYDGEWKFVN